jgi:RHS repeat-associated protein
MCSRTGDNPQKTTKQPQLFRYIFSIAIISLIFLFFIPAAGHADPTSVPGEVAEGVFGEGYKGFGEPDSKTGAMIYSYPFNLPTARGKPQPKLSLTYNSSSHDREAGYGWGFDLPVIERKPLSGNPCFLKDGTPIACGEPATTRKTEERYIYSGQPLVLICKIGGGDKDCGNEPQPDWPSLKLQGWRYFRLQVEGQFSRFYLSPDRRYWRVQLKGGELLEFGEPPNSSNLGIEHTADNKKAILRWRLIRHSDALHKIIDQPVNYVDYRWERIGKRGLLYLTHIYDTPRASGHRTDADFAHHTQLKWEYPDFPETYYADPYRATPDLRLKSVAISSMDWEANGSLRKQIRTYKLNYSKTQGATTTMEHNQVFQIWHHSFLFQIQMQGQCVKIADSGVLVAAASYVPIPEDNKGNIPTNLDCAKLPATTFEYQNGEPIFGTPTVINNIQGGPPNAVKESSVLTYVGSVGIVDFNQDGLPDIVQSWRTSGVFSGGNKQSPPITGYLNRGSDGKIIDLYFQCMDGGMFNDPTGLAYYNQMRTPGFFTGIGGTTLVGTWGEGTVAWSNAQFAPFRANHMGNTFFHPDRLCDPKYFTPTWRWEKVQLDWAKLSLTDPDLSLPPQHEGSRHVFGSKPPRWYTDIDGDGLIDRLVTNGKLAFEFETAFVNYTRRYAMNERGAGSTPAQIPFEPYHLSSNDANSLAPPSLVPREQGYAKHAPKGHQDDSRFYFRSDTKFYYVDINGDGLVDLVTQNQMHNGGIPRVRPGDGHGHFLCHNLRQPWPCQSLPEEPSDFYEIEGKGSRLPWPFSDETYFHDVTGDGLSDIIQYDTESGEIRLWVNQDGHTFACAVDNCLAGRTVNANAANFGLDEVNAHRIGEHRTSFSDMNADGVDDIVFLAREGIYVGAFMKSSVNGQHGKAPRPGLLTRINNGYGATSDITYQTIQELDLVASKKKETAWQYHSPVVENIVTKIVTQDSFHAGSAPNVKNLVIPYQFNRKVEYFYQNPAYDRWSQSFSGFRKVGVRHGDEKATTVTTYWFGPCQNNLLGVRLQGRRDIPLCPEGSDDEVDKSRTGRIIRIDRSLNFGPTGLTEPGFTGSVYVEQPQTLLWTKTFNYSAINNIFNQRNPERHVTFTYPEFIDTYLYDDKKPVLFGGQNLQAAAKGGDPIQYAGIQPGIRKHIRQVVEYDKQGTLIKITDNGALKEEDGNPKDTTTVTLFSSNEPSSPNTPSDIHCNSDWQCLPNYVSIWEPQAQDKRFPDDFANLLRKSHVIYNTTGDVKFVDGWLENAQLLQRHHPTGDKSIAQNPAGQSLVRGWHRLSSLYYDNWGNIVATKGGESPGGSPPSCTTVTYDEPYKQLQNITRSFKDGCEGTALETQSHFHRGFEQVDYSIQPNGKYTSIFFDAFGRPIKFGTSYPDYLPATISGPLTTINYVDKDPVSYVDIQREIDNDTRPVFRTISILNGLGEPVVSFDQGDSLYDNLGYSHDQWVLNGWVERNKSGEVDTMRRPWIFMGDPIEIAENAGGLRLPSYNSFFKIHYDDFGRDISVEENGTEMPTQEIIHKSYFPLAIETRDAEQLNKDGPHGKAFQRVEFDGHGRGIKTTEHIENPTLENIDTTIDYNPTGEPKAVTRTHLGGTYQRYMEYDSLGRLMVNKEPNTGNNWRYVWDDAGRLVGTSDARGCGENFHYDGLGRLLGEDYSPCLASQPAYTIPNIKTGEGLESFYRYDIYEKDQVNPEANFVDDQQFALGHLVSIRDRGSHTRFNYDIRDRVRRISRQVAKPQETSTSTSYAPHWFTSRMDYDLADRLTRRTTGVDVEELLVNGSSEERYTYSERNLPYSIDSSYGGIVNSISYETDGAPTNIVYGDLHTSIASFEYDIKRQLTRYKLETSLIERTFLPINIQTTFFDYHFSSYDKVGNPLVIEDAGKIDWDAALGGYSLNVVPTEKRSMEYDDLYRLIRIDNKYKTEDGNAPWTSPFEREISANDHHPVPLQAQPTRVTQQTFNYDGLGNITASTDDRSVRYDRSLGLDLGYGTPQKGPNQLQSGEGLKILYDEAGNLTELKINRPGDCPTGSDNQCAQWFAYDWDEVGQLARARRWDFNKSVLPCKVPSNKLPSDKPNWDLTYAYSLGGRVRKSVSDSTDVPLHILEVFDTLRVEKSPFDTTDGNYKVNRDNVHAYVGGIAHVFWDTERRSQGLQLEPGISMHLNIGDYLGSSSTVISQSTSELIESTTYQPYGAVENDSRINSFREPYKFTGKEEDVEVGANYFGARYYNANLGRFLSADPLTIHGLGSDLNPYAYVSGKVMREIDPFGLNPCGDDTVDCVVVHGTKPDRGDLANAHGDAMATQAENKQPKSQALTLKNLILGSARIPIPGTKKAYVTPNGVRKVAANVALDLIDPLHYRLMIELFTGRNPFTFHIGEDENDYSKAVGTVVLAVAGAAAGKAIVGGRVSGTLTTDKGVILELTSGAKGGPSALPFPGRNWTIFRHVEAHAAQIMRIGDNEVPIKEAVLEITKAPCSWSSGCAASLESMLPEGSRLRVVGPNGYNRLFVGKPDPLTYPSH